MPAEGSDTEPRLWALAMSGIAVAFVLAAGWHLSQAQAQDAGAKFDPAIRPDFHEPVTLASKDGVLEVTLTAHQGHARFDTVSEPVQNLLVFAYKLARGTASDGQISGDNLYPAPTLQVFPGETLIVHFENALESLTIQDFFDPRYIGEGRGGAALSPDDDLVADQPAHSWRAHQPQGQRRQCHAAHPARDVEHVHVPYPEEHAARRLLVSQPSAWADDAACLLRAGGSACDRADRRQHSARHEAPYPDPQHGAPVQRRLRSRGGTRTDQQCELAAMGQHDQAAGRR